jgi:ribonuclease D
MENANTKRETTPKKKQHSNLLSTNLTDDNHINIKITLIITGSNNHYSLIYLNINGLNSPIKRHRLTDWIHRDLTKLQSFYKVKDTVNRTKQ